MGNNCDNTESLREISFFKGTDRISPSELFDQIYEPVKGLVSHNADHYLNGQRVRVSYGAKFDDHDVAEKMAIVSKSEMRDSDERFTAQAVFDSNNRVSFGVYPRTNFHSSVMKVPSIVYLVKGNKQFIFREARSYEITDLVGSVARRTFGKHFSKGMYDEFGEGFAEKPENLKDVVLVPEAPLVLALEDIAEKTPVPRITPRIKVAGVEGKNMWYVRDFLASVRDSSVEAGHLGEYAGVLHGLGLMDDLDVDPAEYCFQDGFVVNIDPDFFAWTGHDNTLANHGLSSMKRSIKSIGVEDIDSFKKSRKVVVDRTREVLQDETLFDFMPEYIEEANALRYIALDNLETH